MATRDDIAREYCVGSGVELGPGMRPTQVAPGSKLAFVDKRGPDELARYFGSADVVSGERLDSFERGSFDFLIAHHVLEHSPNAIDDLVVWLSYVRDGGVVFLSVPDRHHCADSARLETPANHFITDYILGLDESSFESREHIYSFLSAWHAVGGLAGKSKDEAARLTSLAVHNPQNDLHWHVFSLPALRFVVETAARLIGRKAIVQVIETGAPENEHRIVASLVQAQGVDDEISKLRSLRAELGGFVATFCVKALEGQPLYTLSAQDRDKMFVAEDGKARWVREPRTLIERGIDNAPAQYIEFGATRDSVVGDDIITSTLALAMDRRIAVSDRVKLASGRGLEISPGAAPLLLREAAADLVYCDKVGGEAWKSVYGGRGDMVNSDVVLGDRNLEEIFPDQDFDYIVSSHVLEHIPDFIGFFKSAEIILKPGGDLVMLVPDKRYTFDVLRRPSSVDQIESAHNQKLTHPSREMVVDFFTNIDQGVEAAALWRGDYRPSPSHLNGLEKANSLDLDKTDVHCWVFTPDGLRDLVEHVAAIHTPSLSVVDVSDTPTGGNEFLVHIRKA